MALRIGGAAPVAPAEEELPVEEMAAEEPMPEEMPMEEEAPVGGPVDQDTAGYLGPEHGPFMCGNCQHYQGEGVCEIVSGSIAEDGCCNLFVAVPHAEEEQMPAEEAPMPEEELPAEEELPEETY